MLPLGLIAIGGLIGGAIGGAALSFNHRIFRTQKSVPAKFMLTGLVSGAAFVLDIVIVSFIVLSRPE